MYAHKYCLVVLFSHFFGWSLSTFAVNAAAEKKERKTAVLLRTTRKNASH
jgi:hypothetical protein